MDSFFLAIDVQKSYPHLLRSLQLLDDALDRYYNSLQCSGLTDYRTPNLNSNPLSQVLQHPSPRHSNPFSHVFQPIPLLQPPPLLVPEAVRIVTATRMSQKPPTASCRRKLPQDIKL